MSSTRTPRVPRRDVKDKNEDLTHEPEQIKAYRDTWKLGIHSYLTYLRDRFLLAHGTYFLSQSSTSIPHTDDGWMKAIRFPCAPF
jgi:adenine-specific DNA-methyltransferase